MYSTYIQCVPVLSLCKSVNVVVGLEKTSPVQDEAGQDHFGHRYIIYIQPQYALLANPGSMRAKSVKSCALAQTVWLHGLAMAEVAGVVPPALDIV